MLTIPTLEHHADGHAEWRVWRCDACRLFHIKADGALLTFTPEEYEAFTQRIVECYCGARAQSALDEFTQLPSITEMVN